MTIEQPSVTADFDVSHQPSESTDDKEEEIISGPDSHQGVKISGQYNNGQYDVHSSDLLFAPSPHPSPIKLLHKTGKKADKVRSTGNGGKKERPGISKNSLRR